MRSGVNAHVLGEVTRQLGQVAVQRGRVSAVEQHAIVRWHERTAVAHNALGLDGTLDAALDLDALDRLLEKPGRWALEQALEEPLDGGQRACHQAPSLPAASCAAGWDHL